MSSQQVRINMVLPFTDVVKKLIIINVVIWFGLQVLLDRFFLNGLVLEFLALIPTKAVFSFHIWQPVSYMFLHSTEHISHILINMLMLWMLGSELELRWGPRFFLTYYFVSGVGAAIIYVFGVLIYGLVTGSAGGAMQIPVVGASGAIFGLIVAYGIIFSERTMYFMFLFPIKAKYFMLILAAIEVFTLMNVGVGGSSVANLAHLGGALSGFLFLMISTRRQQSKWKKQPTEKGRKLRLVVNNDSKEDPKYWN